MKISTIIKCLGGTMSVLTIVGNVNAHQLSPEEALSRVYSSSNAKRIPTQNNVALSYTESYDGNDLVYVFNSPDKGFIVVGGDSNMPALLGYSDSDGFDYNDAPDALKWWLSQYAEEAAYAKTILLAEATDRETTTRSESSERQAIPHLLTTQWGQEYPFNLDCPQIGNRKTVTGCVATAMAQIIKYHNYPTSGSGNNTYEWNNTPLSFDYSNCTFHYEEMSDSYSQPQSAASNDAVAKLMLACGVGVNMNYGFEESGASDIYIAYTLRHYFNYDNGVKYLKRNFFTADQWEDLIYAELQQKRPVIYGGEAPNGGHQFVCDGYEDNGFFHINWGWNGYGDGHFLLSALNPEYQGVGGFEGGYNSDQAAICGIQPPVANSKIWYPIYATNNLNVTNITSTTVNIEFTPGALWNYSQEPVDVEILISAVSEDGKEYISEPYPVMFQGDNEPRSTYPFGGANGKNISGYSKPGTLNLPKNLPEGNYKCTVVIKTPEGNIQKIYFPVTAISYFNLTVSSSGSVTYTPGLPEETALIQVTRFEPVTDVIQGNTAQFYITIENYGEIEYSGTIEYNIYKDGKKVNNQPYLVSLPSLQSGESATYILTQAYPFEPGSYDFIFYDQYGKEISAPFSIAIGDTGVDSILSESDTIDIYSPNGMLIKSNTNRDFINALPKGLYILKNNKKSIIVHN